MRRPGRTPPRLPAISAVALLLVVQLVPGGAVLCRAGAGHVAVESTWIGCCAATPPLQTNPACPEPFTCDAATHGAHGGCGPCTDSPFDLSAAVSPDPLAGRPPAPPETVPMVPGGGRSGPVRGAALPAPPGQMPAVISATVLTV